MTRYWPVLPPARARARWASLLVVALLWGQWLGAWHHTLHASGAALQVAVPHALERASRDAPAAVHASVGAAAHAASPVVASEAVASSFFHHVAGGIECRLLDQLLLGDAAPAAQAPPATAQRASTPPTPAPGPLLSVALLRAYLARAPPAC